MQTPEGKNYTVPGLYTAVSHNGIHWTQKGDVGVPRVLGAYGNPGQPPHVSADPTSKPASDGSWPTELSESDAMNFFWDPVASEYRVYSKTWIDGPDGRMFWKRAVMLHTSKDFETWESLPGDIRSPLRPPLSIYNHHVRNLFFSCQGISVSSPTSMTSASIPTPVRLTSREPGRREWSSMRVQSHTWSHPPCM